MLVRLEVNDKLTAVPEQIVAVLELDMVTTGSTVTAITVGVPAQDPEVEFGVMV